MKGLRARSPTIFMNAPNASAASSRTPEAESPRRVTKASETGLTCGGAGGEGVDKRQRCRNLSVPSLI